MPGVVILGPRQCGKSTLAKAIISEIGKAVYLDLERPSDVNKLRDPEAFFSFLHSMIEAQGWYLVETRGGHRQYKHPTILIQVDLHACPRIKCGQLLGQA